MKLEVLHCLAIRKPRRRAVTRLRESLVMRSRSDTTGPLVVYGAALDREEAAARALQGEVQALMSGVSACA
jgi:hypothetical protein